VFIQIERLSASRARCSAPQCNTAVKWSLIDRDMAESHDADSGEQPCCTAHIAATYLRLRGAHLVAKARIARLGEVGAGAYGREPASPRRVETLIGDRHADGTA
jgi:hypothetical protein